MAGWSHHLLILVLGLACILADSHSSERLGINRKCSYRTCSSGLVDEKGAMFYTFDWDGKQA
jgi:hypothetical protein